MEKVFGFLRESWTELKKVVWPSRRKTVRLTVAVLVITFGVAGFTAVLDYFFSRMLNLLVER
ncbi:preprotein translocase subunit SecE [candidate division WWE3 bacterium RBG_19FT_COMBO_53_11]|uniref:Protein translocase subunit SecE n=1 Tax=candidate division WWE3 bacterium RBG_19FT_COMBO_53_11 TaxID=1802613 RepID=A0A1F4UJA7_UNCKA|nr:MAG: preprotein translocase subunit SecE [candidate division WWE3 bacterium RBG_16_52_45]OGC44999.1 MAG: preprotein translocase subunit SecE [candidate division WWE3 bacterium RBG_19FT_COMBO_53_11]